jgi:HB1, ASXL, restriction endonuclease HTH domain
MSKKLKNTDLKEALASAEAELISVLKRAETLREWIAVTKKLCAKNTKNAAEAEGTVVSRFRRTRTTGLVQHIVEVLRSAGSPLHVDDIVKKLAENNHPVTAKNPKATIAIALSRRTDEFRKTAPNTFGLASEKPQEMVVNVGN